MKSAVLTFVVLVFLLSSPAPAQQKFRAGIVAPEVVGSFQPLSSEEAFETLLAELRQQAPAGEFVVLEANDKTFSDAAEYGRANNFDILMWGRIRFKEAPGNLSLSSDRPDKNDVSAEIDIKVFSVQKAQFLIRSSTWVSSDTWARPSKKEQSDRKLAKRCLGRGAESMIWTVKRKLETGWFHRH